jgi:hypothetical protein
MTMPLTREFTETGTEPHQAGPQIPDGTPGRRGVSPGTQSRYEATKSLMRMFGPDGNPQARNLFGVIGHLQRAEGLQFELSLKAAS